MMKNKNAENQDLDTIILSDRKNATRDVIIGATMQTSAVALVAGAAYAAVRPGQYGLAAILAGLSGFVMAAVLIGAGCYFYTPPSQRKEYYEMHPRTARIINYFKAIRKAF